MALKEYKKKRSFTQTPEPEGGKPSADTLQFVVQKHHASHLHYDFRLELDGVLKSWAVPKGPSMNPADKRLAMQVEDHPFDYKDFEGIIPAGNYGAGTVMVWDAGTYEPLSDTKENKSAEEKVLRKELLAGSLKFRLNGKKLKGEFALVRTRGRGDKSWLLIKHRDKYATEEPVTDKDKSVVSRKTLEQIAGNPKSRKWQAADNTAKPKKGAPKGVKSTAGRQAGTKQAKTSAKAGRQAEVKQVGRKAPMPKKIIPMLATLVDKPFDKDRWQYEVKWDGYRALAYLKNGKVELRSRNDKSFDERFYPVHATLEGWKVNAVLDGEIVVINDKGQSDFGALQNWRSEADGRLIYYLFDILWLENRDVMGLPLVERQELLNSIVPEDDIIRISDHFNTTGTEFYAAVQKMGLEGIMAKQIDSLYSPGARSHEWLKIKTANRQEVVIGGYTRNKGTSKTFSSLLVGVFEKGGLRYTGKIGTGFGDEMQKEMMQRFKPLVQKESPFQILPDVNKPSRFRPNPPTAQAVWLKPKLLCAVSFREMTADGIMRHPSFEGMRDDKDAKAVKLEKPKPVEKVVGGKKKGGRTALAADKILAPVKARERKTLLNPGDESQTREINGHELHFTHLSKIFWPDEKITKRDLLNYYYQVAPYMMPYLKDRPQSLNRHPNGIKGKSFYQKDVKGKVADWLATFPYHSKEESRDKEFLVCTDEASLLYIASLGCIEINPWSSTVQSPDNPDWCIIDLDPGPKTPFEKVIEAAQVTGKVLKSAGITACCKTSGSTGMHVYFPLGGRYTYEHSKEFARLVVQIVQAELPSFTTIERSTAGRQGKMYLDFLQNRPQATLAAPYSVRPKPGATVSAPLHWDEVKKGLKIQQFTMKNMPARLKAEGDLFKPVLGKGINMEKALKALMAQKSEGKKENRK